MAEVVESEVVEVTDSDTTEIAEAKTNDVMAKNTASAELFSSNPFESKQSFNNYYMMANQLAASDMIPESYQKKPMNVMIALEQASRMNCSPLFVMQNLSIVKGHPNWSGSACCQFVNGCGLFRSVKLNYVGEKGKDTYGAYVSAIRKEDDEEVIGTTITMAMVKSEGWNRNPKWQSMTDQMLGYRAYSFFARLYCPAVLSGFSTEGEIDDIKANKQIKVDNPF